MRVRVRVRDRVRVRVRVRDRVRDRARIRVRVRSEKECAASHLLLLFLLLLCRALLRGHRHLLGGLGELGRLLERLLEVRLARRRVGRRRVEESLPYQEGGPAMLGKRACHVREEGLPC